MASERHTKAFWRRANRLATSIALVGGVVLYIAFEDGRALAMGLLLGALVSLLRFRLRYRAVTSGASKGALLRTGFFSYGLSAAGLALAFGFPDTFSPWTTIAGLFAMNAALILAELLTPREGAPSSGVRGGQSS